MLGLLTFPTCNLKFERTLLMKHFSLRIQIAMSLATVAMFVTASAFARTGTQGFILHNQTGDEINSLYVSPHSADDWEEDILGKDTLATGVSLKISIDDRGKDVLRALKV